MTDSEAPILVEDRGAIRLVTLNRPDVLNAADSRMHTDLARFWDELPYDEEVRAVVITGAGRAFSAGGDLNFMTAHAEQTARWRIMEEARRMVSGMLHSAVPIIAAVNGPAVGLGSTVALMCDFIVIADNAFLADGHVAVGLVAGDGGATTLPAVIGLPRAKEFFLLGERMPAQRAVELGVAISAVPQDRVLPEALALAERLAALPQHALRDTKRLLNQSLEIAFASTRNYGYVSERYSMTDPDHQAFLADRRAKTEARAAEDE